MYSAAMDDSIVDDTTEQNYTTSLTCIDCSRLETECGYGGVWRGYDCKTYTSSVDPP